MKILIIDDEYLILNELKEAICWSKLGIDVVLTAYSIDQSKKIIAQNDVNIILCDIELPEGSGLDLLAWVKDNYPDIETLILTCHVDFSYAKQAVNLGCLDYILKPVQYHELEEAITKAIEKVRTGEKLLKHSNYGDYWLKHMPIMVERFWFNIISQSIAPNMKAIMAAAESRDIPFSADMKFLPILIENRRWHKEMDLFDQKVMEFAMKNVAGETIFMQGENGLIVDYGRYNYIAILSCETDFQYATLHSTCAFFIETCNNFLGCDMNCYVGEPAFADAISNSVLRLLDMKGNNVVHDNCVLFLNMSIEDSNTRKCVTPDLKFWEILLNDGYYDEVFAESIKYLGRLSQSALADATLLRQFDFEFMQMIFSVFKKHNINYSNLLNSKESIRLHDNALHSVTDMEAWISYILKDVQSQLKISSDQDAIVNEVSRIVKRDIYQDISRNEIAEIMHMNTDYLDRVFKKETGLSMKKFIVREKINIAKKLLEETELPITIIAVKLGYKNMSHFSNVFKMHTNLNPMDYRKDFKYSNQ